MKILYQDAHLVLCEKPVGVLSQSAPGQADDMTQRLKDALGGEIHVVHRLDRGVGGLMVYARTRKAAAALSEAIRQRSFIKEYRCVVQGVPEQSAATLEDLLYWDAARSKSFPVTRERKGVKSASLEYETLATTGQLSLLRVRLHTGRTHQIRVQFASRRHPLVNDRKYGADSAGDIALWSCRLAFAHPITGKEMNFTLPLPKSTPWNLFPSAE